jgi:hypothetical protein
MLLGFLDDQTALYPSQTVRRESSPSFLPASHGLLIYHVPVKAPLFTLFYSESSCLCCLFTLGADSGSPLRDAHCVLTLGDPRSTPAGCVLCEASPPPAATLCPPLPLPLSPPPSMIRELQRQRKGKTKKQLGHPEPAGPGQRGQLASSARTSRDTEACPQKPYHGQGL